MQSLSFVAVSLLAALTAGCAAPEWVGSIAPVSATSRAGDARAAAALITQYRSAYGLGPVRVDPSLNAAAEHQARANARTGSLDHGDFAGRMAAYGIQGQAAENLSASVPSVEAAVAQWKGSPGHNQNLLVPGFTRIGLARADTPGRGWGRYWALVLAR